MRQWKWAHLPSLFNKHLLTASSMPGAAQGCFTSFNTHNSPGRLRFSSPSPKKDREVLKEVGMPLAVQ